MHIQRTYDPHRDLLELRGLERPACSNTLVPRGSHHISSLWSSGCNRWQSVASATPPKRLTQAKTVAVACDQLPEPFMVRSRSRTAERLPPAPDENSRPGYFHHRGSTVRVRQRASAFSLLRHRFRFKRDADRMFRRPPSVHQRPRRRVECIEQLDRVLASVAGEVAVVAVDHREA